MANTLHQDVVSLRRKGVRNRGGNSLQALRQASSKGKSAVSDTRKVPRGFTAVPVSTASLPPGLGPPMSSVNSSRGMGKLRKNAKVKVRSSSVGPSPYPAYGGTSVWNASPIWNPAAVSDLVASSSRRGRRGRKR